MELSFTPFARDAACQLEADGWLLVALPGGLTLAGLRAAGAPFKGTRYFDVHARDTAERTTLPLAAAYKPALLPGTYNLSFDEAAARVAALSDDLPSGAVACIAPAAAYVWLFQHHKDVFGAYPFVQRYTWAADRYQGRTHLVVGVFGRERPLLVAPLTEGRGAGVGVWPLVVPRAAEPRLWPPAAG